MAFAIFPSLARAIFGLAGCHFNFAQPMTFQPCADMTLACASGRRIVSEGDDLAKYDHA
jgi:hypothetical protein